MTIIDTKHTRNPVCPYCGYVEHNAWDINFGPYSEGDTEIDCGKCEKHSENVRLLILRRKYE